MSVTVQDCLKTSALKSARVLGGHAGLSKIVTAVSVLEYAEHSVLDDVFFAGNELIISALVTVKDDVNAQCATIRRLWETGEVGLVLYYVGVFVPKVDKKLIALCDELAFPLICLPEKQLGFRYSEALLEIYELIFLDTLQQDTLFDDARRILSQLPPKHRNLQTILRLLSDRLRSTLMLFDATYEHSAIASWPMADMWNKDDVTSQCKAQIHCEKTTLSIKHGTAIAKAKHIMLAQNHQNDGIHLLALGEGELPSDSLLSRAGDVILASMKEWGYTLKSESEGALIQAILNDDPLKMRRIATAMNVDIAAINTMWIVKHEGEHTDDALVKAAALAKTFLREERKLSIVDVVKDGLVLFMNDAPYLELDAGLAEKLMTSLPDTQGQFLLFSMYSLKDSAAVRKAYMQCEDAWKIACKLYPVKRIFTLRELVFAKECEEAISGGEAHIEELCAPLRSIESLEDGAELINTLAVFLLDANANTRETGEMMFLHKNTVNYRINKIKQHIGYDITKMPESFALYRAISVYRLLQN